MTSSSQWQIFERPVSIHGLCTLNTLKDSFRGCPGGKGADCINPGSHGFSALDSRAGVIAGIGCRAGVVTAINCGTGVITASLGRNRKRYNTVPVSGGMYRSNRSCKTVMGHGGDFAELGFLKRRIGKNDSNRRIERCPSGIACRGTGFILLHLPQAKQLAQKQNLDGARFPWMCAFDGTEQCESWDIGLCEVHITADVAYALQRMLTITGQTPTEDMRRLFLETARYWKSRFTWEESKGQYSAFFVKGPDEYCGAAVNNTYTNYLARHNVELALQYASDLMDDQEKEALRFFADHIAILYDPEKHLYKQDELFERLEPLPGNRDAGEPLYRTICFDRMQRYKALKQADLVQLIVMFPERFTDQEKLAIWQTYEPLTVHDSSLSFGMHALLAFQLDLQEEAWNYFVRALFFDLRDELRNTGREGVHMAALGAAWQALVFGALGVWTDEKELRTAPHLPDSIRSVSLPLWFRGERYRLNASHDKISLVKEE